MKKEKKLISAERRIWIFIAYNEDGVPFFSKLFLDHAELKMFSGKHSVEWKDKCKEYSSTYLNLFDHSILPESLKKLY